MTNQTVWVVLSAESVAQDLRDLIDKGLLAEANKYTYYLQSFLDKIKTFVQARGGHMAINLYDKQIMEIPLTAAEELPNILDEYQDQLKHKIAIGVGLTLSEASHAVMKSYNTGQIELYEPSQAEYVADNYQKAGEPDQVEGEGWEVPPNLFDPKTPSPESDKIQLKRQPDQKPKAVLRPALQEELQAEKQLLDGINAQIAPPQQEGAPAGQQQQPQDLLEALHGGPVPGRTQSPDEQAQGGQAVTDQTQGNSPESPEGSEEEVEAEVEDAEAEAKQTNQKLATLLSTVKTQIPQIMALHETNPDAFKQAMNMVNKLVQLAHGRKKAEKAEILAEAEELEKAFRKRIVHWKGKLHHRYPVGTRLGRRVKVLVDGKEVWRQQASGRVKDHTGESISVRSSNHLAENPNANTPINPLMNKR